MSVERNPAATDHLPWFLASPDGSDGLLVATAVIVTIAVFGLGVLFFKLHSLPERMGHKKLQFEIVAVLCLLSLFTHIHLFWVIALLLAFIDLPDFATPLRSMAESLGRLANGAGAEPPQAAPKPGPPVEPGA